MSQHGCLFSMVDNSEPIDGCLTMVQSRKQQPSCLPGLPFRGGSWEGTIVLASLLVHGTEGSA